MVATYIAFRAAHLGRSAGRTAAVATATVGGEELFGGARFVKPFRGGVTDVGVITLSDIVRWVQPSDGLWADAVNWEPFFVPAAGRHVAVDLSGAQITVTYDADVPFDGPLADLLCNERLRIHRGMLSVAGPFQMNNTLEMACGTLIDSVVDLGPDGLINVVCLSDFDGVTVNGNMDLLVNSRGLRIRNGLTINGDIRIAGFTGSAATDLAFLVPGVSSLVRGRFRSSAIRVTRALSVLTTCTSGPALRFGVRRAVLADPMRR